MPKLLSNQEGNDIATRMTEEYGLPPPDIYHDGSYSYAPWTVRIVILRVRSRRVIDWFPWWRKRYTAEVTSLNANSLEEGLVKLQQELAKFDPRTKIAEAFRDKYARKEADELLDKVLSDP